MLKFYVKTSEALRRLRTDNAGVVSLEYVIVGAVCLRRRHCSCFRALARIPSTER